MSNSQDQRALGKLRVGTDRLMDKYPFHACLVHRMILTRDPSIKTLAVTIGHSDVEGYTVLLLYNPEFVLELPMDQLVGGLLHEVHHVLFGHLSMKRSEFPNYSALVIAQECTVNEFVKEPLPEWVISLDKYPDLPPMEGTIERYNRLKNVIPETTVTITFDDHGVWAKVEGASSEQEAQEAIKGAVGKLVEEAIEDYSDKGEPIPPELEEAIQYGQGPGIEFYHFQHKKKGALPWQQLLAKYVGQALEVRPQYHRPNRRFPDLVGIIPGKSRSCQKPRVMFQLDTSGSITEDMLEQANGELKKLAKDYQVTVVEFGDTVYHTYPFKGGLSQVYGRGGNEGAPGLDKDFLAKHKPDLVVIMTDGHLCVPIDHWSLVEHPKVNGAKIPLLWIIQPGGVHPVPWGRVVYMDRR